MPKKKTTSKKNRKDCESSYNIDQVIVEMEARGELSKEAKERLLECLREKQHWLEASLLEYKKMAAVVDHSLDLVLIIQINKQNRIVYANPALTRITGYQLSNVVGEKIERVFPILDSKLARDLWKQVKQQKDIKTTIVSQKKNGKRYHAEVRGFFLGTSDGKGLFYALIIEDITQKKQEEEEKNRLVKIQKQIIDQAPFGVYIVNRQGVIEYINPAMINISGDAAKQLIGLNAFKLKSYTQEGIAHKIKEAFSNKKFVLSNVEHQSISGNKTIRNFYGFPILNSQGQVEKVLVFVEDITKQIKAERQLLAEQKKYQLVIKETGQIIYDYDLKADQIDWSGAIKEITGFSNKFFNQRVNFEAWVQMIHPMDRHQLLSLLDKIKKYKKKYLIEYRFKTRFGYRWFQDSGTFVYNDKDRAYSMLGAIKDVNEFKKTISDLQKKTEELEKLNSFMVGRELKMIELKKKISDLQNQLYELQKRK